MKNEKKDKKFIFFFFKSPIASIYIFLYTDLLMLVVIYTHHPYITSTDRGIITHRVHLLTDHG